MTMSSLLLKIRILVVLLVPSTDIATARSYSPDMKQMKKTKKKIKSFKTGVKVPILTFHNVDAVMARG